MRYRCVMNEQEYVVEVELGSDRARATIYSAEPEMAFLHAYNPTIDTTRGYAPPDGFEEVIARDALANYAAGGDSFEQGPAFSGALIPLL